MGSKRTIFEGDVFTNTRGTKAVVVEYVHAKWIKVKFQDEYGYEDYFGGRDLRNGYFNNPYDRTVHGVGFIGVGEYKTSINGVQTFAYKKWARMFSRCYTEGRMSAFYHDCTVNSIWHNYQNFAKWAEQQIGFGNDSWHLDKDLISLNNREYGPHVCCFIPDRVNKLLLNRAACRTEVPVGVVKRKDCNRYAVQGYDKECKSFYVGMYETPEEAFSFYKAHRESVIKQVAEQYRSVIDVRVYTSLMNYVIEIDS